VGTVDDASGETGPGRQQPGGAKPKALIEIAGEQ
jgi:hypothetical protein